jgi:hypothetical protein
LIIGPVIKRGVLRSSYQEGSVGIQLSRGEGWDPVIKRGGLRSSYQEGRVEIQLSRGECWDPVIKRGVLGPSYQEGRVGIQLSRAASGSLLRFISVTEVFCHEYTSRSSSVQLMLSNSP